MTDSPGNRSTDAKQPIDKTSTLPSGTIDERFPRSRRIRSRVDFDALFQRGKVSVDSVLVIHARPAPDCGRIGISISKRVGHSPCRNRWKRLIREAYRHLFNRTPALQHIELVVRPRRGAQPSYAAIERSLRTLAMRVERQLKRNDER